MRQRRWEAERGREVRRSGDREAGREVYGLVLMRASHRIIGRCASAPDVVCSSAAKLRKLAGVFRLQPYLSQGKMSKKADRNPHLRVSAEVSRVVSRGVT